MTRNVYLESYNRQRKKPQNFVLDELRVNEIVTVSLSDRLSACQLVCFLLEMEILRRHWHTYMLPACVIFVLLINLWQWKKACYRTTRILSHLGQLA